MHPTVSFEASVTVNLTALFNDQREVGKHRITIMHNSAGKVLGADTALRGIKRGHLAEIVPA